MGRRALRKIDPSLDLARHFRAIEDLEDDWQVETLFDNDAPLEIDVGCGKGMFVLGAGLAVPKENWLGIEVSRKYARFSAARLANRELTNGAILHGDAERFFAERLGDVSLAGVHVYFPDPWWKKRHHRRRIMNERFVAQVERVLIPGGRLHFWTDVSDYFDMGLEAVREATKLNGPLPVDEQSPLAAIEYRTNFERRTRLAGEPVYNAEFEKP
jgi:tRNA (guanine-N7-)-methyltransferase